MRSRRHSGFNVDHIVQLGAGDREEIQRLNQYLGWCPCLQARMLPATKAGQVFHKTMHHAVSLLPGSGDDELPAGAACNFQVFDPLDLLPEVIGHTPGPGEHLIHYYGWYSNRPAQRLVRQSRLAASTGVVIPVHSPTRGRSARAGRRPPPTPESRPSTSRGQFCPASPWLAPSSQTQFSRVEKPFSYSTYFCFNLLTRG